MAHREPFKIRNVSSSFSNNSASTQVYFDNEKLTLEELIDIRREIRERLPVIPGAEIELGRQAGAESQTFISVNMYGDDNVRLQALAREARGRLMDRGDFNEIQAGNERAREEVQIVLKRDLARRYGVSPQSVARLLGIVIRGREIRGYRTPEGEVEIWLWLQPGDREDLEDLKSVVVGNGPGGREIVLSQVAEFRRIDSPSVIRRENRRTYTEIGVSYSGGKKEEGKRLMSEVMDSLDYPAGYGWTYGFWTQRQDQDNLDFILNLLLAFLMVYFVMASLFESLAHPFAIMFSLPFALVGVTWFLFLTGTPFQHHVPDRPHGSPGDRGEQRHRAHRPHQQPQEPGVVAVRGDPDRVPRAVPPHSDDGRNHRGGTHSPGAGHHRNVRTSLFPAGPHRHGRPDLLDPPHPGGPARLLHPLRRPGHMAQAPLVAEHSVSFVSGEVAQSPPPTRL